MGDVALIIFLQNSQKFKIIIFNSCSRARIVYFNCINLWLHINYFIDFMEDGPVSIWVATA